MIRRTLLSLFAIWFLTPMEPVNARDIRIAFAGEMAPFFYQRSGNWQGLSIEVARTILELAGHTVKSIDSLPMARVELLFRRGDIDLHPNLSPTPKRSKVAVFTTIPHILEAHSFIALRGVSVPYDGSMGSLAGFRIAAMRGWTHGNNFDSAQSLDKIFVKKVLSQVRMLSIGRVQLAVQNPATFFFHAQKIGYHPNGYQVLDPPAVELPVYMGISKSLKGAEDLRDSLDRALAGFLKSDAYQALKKRHGF